MIRKFIFNLLFVTALFSVAPLMRRCQTMPHVPECVLHALPALMTALRRRPFREAVR